MLERNPLAQELLAKGFSVSTQEHLRPGRPTKCTAFAKSEAGKRCQGWGRSVEDALVDLRRRLGPPR